MFTKGLSERTQSNLELLRKVAFAKDYYLAGGTSLSLHYGHRFSNDLDFFSQYPVEPEIIRLELSKIGKLEILQNDKGTFNGLLNEVKLSFFIYPYPLLVPSLDFDGIKVADIPDIAAMKIDAVSSRGTKRDFIDLYFICKRFKPIEELLAIFEKKFSGVKFNELHIVKSLVYFTDAEDQEMPKMIEKVEWKEVKSFFEKEAVRLGKKYLNG
jgi:predicted nucleotidyltransferase component of viral defense system